MICKHSMRKPISRCEIQTNKWNQTEATPTHLYSVCLSRICGPNKNIQHLNHFRCEFNLPSVDHVEVVDKCKRRF